MHSFRPIIGNVRFLGKASESSLFRRGDSSWKSNVLQTLIVPRVQHATFLDGFRNTMSNFTGRMRDSATRRVDRKRQEQEGEHQEKLLEVLLRKPRWTGQDFEAQLRESYESGSSGWKTYVPGYKDQSGIDELEGLLSILEVMTEDEKRNHKTVRHIQRERIAQASGQTVEKVDALLQQIHMISTISHWIQRRKRDNLPLPKSIEDVQTGMLSDKRGLPGPMPRWTFKAGKRVKKFR